MLQYSALSFPKRHRSLLQFETWLQDRNRSQEDEVDKCYKLKTYALMLVTMDPELLKSLALSVPRQEKILVNPTINPANAIETGSEKTEQP